jgi:hypothetical protein
MPDVTISMHERQLEIFEDQARNKVVVCGRRFGKSRLVTYNLILKSLLFPGEIDPASQQIVLGALPNAVLARKILWRPLYALATTTFRDFFEDINRTQMLLTPKGNKPLIQIVGTNDSNGDGLRGLRLYHASVDEFQDVKPGVLEQVIQPALSDTENSTLMLTGTPKGKLNHLHSAFKMEESHADWKSWNLPTILNPFFPAEELEIKRASLPPRIFRQEYEASFESFDNMVYPELTDDNLTNHEPSDPLAYIWGVDWGEKHPAVVVFSVTKDAQGHEVFTYVSGWTPTENVVILWDTFVSKMMQLKALYPPAIVYCDPSRPASILELRKIVPAIAAYNSIEEGITQVHSLIYQRRLMFLSYPRDAGFTPTTGVQLKDEMTAYYRAKSKDGTILQTIAPNQDDHMTDALRYALARKKPK